jgi:hypothetical protein
MSIEAMKQAHEVPLVEQLESVPNNARLVIDDADGMGTRYIPVGRMCHDASKALRQAIAEAEKQKPIGKAYLCDKCHTPFDDKWECPSCGHNSATQEDVYFHPQQRTWVGLTDDEMLMIYGQQHEGKKYSLGRMVQQALKEKNT